MRDKNSKNRPSMRDFFLSPCPANLILGVVRQVSIIAACGLMIGYLYSLPTAGFFHYSLFTLQNVPRIYGGAPYGRSAADYTT